MLCMGEFTFFENIDHYARFSQAFHPGIFCPIRPVESYDIPETSVSSFLPPGPIQRPCLRWPDEDPNLWLDCTPSKACCSIFRAPSRAICYNTDLASQFSVQKPSFCVYCFISISLSYFGNIFVKQPFQRICFFIILSTIFAYNSLPFCIAL